MKISHHVIRAVILLGLWLGGAWAAQAQTRTVHLYYTDPQGTPLVKTDASGNVIAKYDYTPYGNSVASLGSPPNGPGYTGHVNDPETGLVYMQARYYQPTGRFLSPDSVDPSAGNLFNFNRYGYANNNPIANTDPTGMCSPTDGFPCYQEGDDDPYAGHFYVQDQEKNEITKEQESDRKAIAASAPYVYGAAKLIPGVGLAACASSGCSGIDWVFAAIGAIPGGGEVGAAVKGGEEAVEALKGVAQVTLNREAGNAFRDELAGQLSQGGRQVTTEVYKRTPFGKRFIDIEVSRDGTVLGGIETKVGRSRYTNLQQLKDWWLTNVEGYPVNVARKP